MIKTAQKLWRMTEPVSSRTQREFGGARIYHCTSVTMWRWQLFTMQARASPFLRKPSMPRFRNSSGVFNQFCLPKLHKSSQKPGHERGFVHWCHQIKKLTERTKQVKQTKPTNFLWRFAADMTPFQCFSWITFLVDGTVFWWNKNAAAKKTCRLQRCILWPKSDRKCHKFIFKLVSVRQSLASGFQINRFQYDHRGSQHGSLLTIMTRTESKLCQMRCRYS